MAYSAAVEEILAGGGTWELNKGTATDSGFGLHVGLGLEYSLSPAVSIFLETRGRQVRMNDWTADQTHSDPTASLSETGTFWYAERFQPDFGRSYATFVFDKDRPDEWDLRNVRKMALDFSGFALKAGFKIGF
jgi:hypothetical protein